MTPIRRKIRSNKQQIEYLCKYMHEHKDFATGDMESLVQMERQWVELKLELDKLGIVRSVEQWKTCWRDQKRKAKLSSNDFKSSMKDNNDSIPVSSTIALILDTIGTEPIEFVQLPPAMAEAQPRTCTSPSLSSSPRTPSPNIATTRQSPRLRRRFRSSQLPVRSLKAQLELNGLLRDLNKELRRSNTLKAEQNYLLRKLCKK